METNIKILSQGWEKIQEEINFNIEWLCHCKLLPIKEEEIFLSIWGLLTSKQKILCHKSMVW